MEPARVTLHREIQRQIDSISSCPSQPTKKGSHPGLCLKQESQDYSSDLKRILNARQSRTEVWNKEPIARDVAVKIASFCEPSGKPLWFLDPNDMKSRLRVLISHRPEQPNINHSSYTSIWKNSSVRQWASANESSLLIFQAAYSAKTLMEIAALDLVDYLVSESRNVVWAFNSVPRAVGEEQIAGQGDNILRQIALQILAKNDSFRFFGRLSSVAKLILSAKDDEDWIKVIQTALEGISLMYVVIDIETFAFGVLSRDRDRVQKQLEVWQGSFKILIDDLRKRSPATRLKVLILCPLQKNASSLGVPVVQIKSVEFLNAETFRPQGRKPSGEKARLELPLLSEDDIVSEEPVALETWDTDTDTAPEIGSVAAKSKGAKDWFYQMKSYEKCIDACRRDPDEANPRVKIAVLDTGLDLTHPDIAKQYDDGRIKIRDFIEKEDTIKDLDGHGTHCTSLLLNNAPNAEIYAGRVFRKSRAEDSSAATLAEAINYAAQVWKVDIISISLGFTQDSDDMRSAVKKASADNILIFAAAANNTTNEQTPIRFPARMAEAMCIFSSNSSGRPSDFNPPARYDKPNFTFPGEKIEGAWPSSIPSENTTRRGEAVYKVQDGTSVATPIAAAVAAGIIEFANQKRAFELKRVHLLKDHRGMTGVFLRWMVDRYKTGEKDFHYVKPWMLFGTSRNQDVIPICISLSIDNIDT